VLFGECIGERRARDESALDNDLAQAAARLLLLLEGLGKLLLAEEARSNQDPAELGCWKFRRVHNSSYRPPRSIRESDSQLSCAQGLAGSRLMAVELPELIVRDAAAWRAWLAEHHADPSGVWLVLAKKGTENPTSLTYDQALRLRRGGKR